MRKHFDKLTLRHQTFVQEYAADKNGSRAAIEAGYKASPSMIATRLLKREDIQLALQELLAPVMKKAEITVERVLLQLEKFAFSNIAEYIGEDGTLKVAICDLPEEIQQCIVEVNRHDRYSKEGELLSSSTKVRLVDKLSALRMCAEYLKLLSPGINQTNINVNGVDVDDFWKRQFYERAQTVPPDVLEGKFKELESR